MKVKKFFRVVVREWRIFLKDSVKVVKKIRKDWKFQNFLINYKPRLRTAAERAAILDKMKRASENCDHIKGGPFRSSYGKDYNLSRHIFIDGSERIRCNQCGRKWVPTDPDYKDMLKLLELSTNKMSTSECPLIRVSDHFLTLDQIRAGYRN